MDGRMDEWRCEQMDERVCVWMDGHGALQRAGKKETSRETQ